MATQRGRFGAALAPMGPLPRALVIAIHARRLLPCACPCDCDGRGVRFSVRPRWSR